MAYSTQRALSDGTLREILLTIGFIDREDINVYVDDQLITVTGAADPSDITYEWVTDNLIRFSEDIPDGSEVLLQRATHLGTVLNVFSSGASFDDPTMDENFRQLLYIAQEAREGTSIAEVFQDIDMHGYRLLNLGVATEPGHAVPLQQMQSESTWAYQSRVAAEGFRNEAEGFRDDAANSALEAEMWASQLGAIPGRLDELEQFRANMGVLYAADFGLVGDGSDETAKFQTAVTAAATQRKRLVGDRTKTYKITGTVVGASHCHLQDINLDVSEMTGTKHPLVFEGSVDSGVALTADVAKGTYAIQVSDASGFAADDWLLLTTDTSYYPFPGYNVARGEWLQVRSVIGNTVKVTTPLVQSYAAASGAKLRKATFVEDVVLDNITLVGSATPNSNERGICLRYTKGAVVKNCTFTGLDQYALEVSSSIKFNIRHNKFRGTFYDGVTGLIFYAIVLLDSCQYFTIHDNHGARCRHLVVTTALSAGQGRWGQCMFGVIHDNVVEDCMSGGEGRSYAYEMHGTGQHLTWANNIANGCYAFMRIEGGSDSQVIGGGCNGYGYQGLIIGGDGSTVRNIDVRGVRIANYTGEVTTGLPAGIRFETSNVIENVTVDGVVISGAAISNVGAAISIGASVTSRNNHIKNVRADAGVSESTGTAVALAAGVTGLDFENCDLFGWRGGYSISTSKIRVRGGSVGNFSAGAGGFGYYSSGTRNICDGVHFYRINTAIRLDVGSANCLAVNNTMTDCIVAAPSDDGTGNVTTPNYAV